MTDKAISNAQTGRGAISSANTTGTTSNTPDKQAELIEKCRLTEEEEIAIVESCQLGDRLWYKHDHALCNAQLTKAIAIISAYFKSLESKAEIKVTDVYGWTDQEVKVAIAEARKQERERILAILDLPNNFVQRVINDDSEYSEQEYLFSVAPEFIESVAKDKGKDAFYKVLLSYKEGQALEGDTNDTEG